MPLRGAASVEGSARAFDASARPGAAVDLPSASVARPAHRSAEPRPRRGGPRKAVIHIKLCQFPQHRSEMAIHTEPPLWIPSLMTRRRWPIRVLLNPM